ncbi:MAG: hypothetical protein HF314_16145 [Ignavibacteria bacterium]|jgi:hypothetical protein|nr:hypothetical protein [Ignavibacteria bacterium]MCU7504613.1 hypothetical protein [Ignavibacteria bacterium]MCU7517971.1 hypothetical protein [Ignavibacteria bacterium]
MRKCLRFTCLLILAGISIPLKLGAQVSGEAGYSILYTDNPFRSNGGGQEIVNLVQPSITYKPFQSEFYTGYSFGYSSFKNSSDRSYYYHSGELSYAFRLGVDTTEDENISLGASYMKASNNSGGGVYSYDAYSVNASGKFFLQDNLLLTAGYALSGKSYPALYDLSYTVNSGFMRMSLFFETKTSLFLEAQLGNKSYSVEDPVEITINRPGNHGMEGGSIVLVRNSYISTNITQLRVMPKISQTVLEGVGMNLHYMWRKNLDKNSAISLSEFIYSDDEDLWDDPYSFESNEAGSELTIKLPWAMTFKASLEQSYRNYTENLAEAGTVSQRKDRRTEIWFGLNKEFTDLPLINALEAGLEFMRVMNHSNESALSYNNNMAMFRVSVGF